MNRRDCLKAVALAGAAAQTHAVAAAAPPIQLHVDMDVDPAKEQEMLKNYRATFRPAITKQPGFVEVKLMKLRKVLAGQGPANTAYRLLISFQTEEQRLKWVATDTHQKVWPTIESCLRGAKYSVVLFDVV
jgi:hypothetical protein